MGVKVFLKMATVRNEKSRRQSHCAACNLLGYVAVCSVSDTDLNGGLMKCGFPKSAGYFSCRHENGTFLGSGRFYYGGVEKSVGVSRNFKLDGNFQF